LRQLIDSLAGLSAVDADALTAFIIKGLGVKLTPLPPLKDSLKPLASDIAALTDSDKVVLLGLIASLSAASGALFIRARNHDETFRNLSLAARERLDRSDESALIEALPPAIKKQIRGRLS
jgi:hypothetical protein